MASRFADVSKFRNAVFASHKREEWYSFDRSLVAPGADASSNIDANADFIAFKSTGNSVGLCHLGKPGKPTHVSEVSVGFSPSVLSFSPHFASEPHLLAAGGENGSVSLVSLESNADSNAISASSTVTLQGHVNKRVETLSFHPTTSGIIASAAGAEALLWDVAKSESKATLADLKDTVWSLSYSHDGTVIAATSKDTTLKLFDGRTGSLTASVVASHGPKAWRALFLTGVSADHILTTGFSSQRQRELKIWDQRNFTKPIITKSIDSDPSVLIPVYDHDTNMLVLAARGSPVVRWYETKATGITDGATTYSGRETLLGLCSVPKPALDVMKCEVLRLLAPTADGNSIIPISANVPRRSYLDFQHELYPETRAGVFAMEAAEFWEGGQKPLATMSLDPQKRAAAVKVQPAAPAAATPVAAPPTAVAAAVVSVSASTSSTPAEAMSSAAAPSEPTSSTPLETSKAAETPTTSSTSSAPPKPVVPVKTSAFRFLSGNGHVKYDSLRSLSIVIPNESDAIAATDLFIAVPIAGPGGRIGIIYTKDAGKPNAPARLPAQIPCLLNGSDVHDFAADPFDRNRIAAACDDGKVRVWKVAEGMEGDRDASSVDQVFLAHGTRCNVLKFHPRAKNVLLTCSTDKTARIWDLSSTDKCLLEITLPDSTLGAAWSPDGTKVAFAGRDKKLRVFDARSGSKLHEWESHDGIKGARVVWLGESGRLLSVGFGKASKREINVYDTATEGTALKSSTVDINPGIPTIHYDEDLQILFFAGRGDRNVSIWGINEDGSANLLTRYEAGHVQQGFAFFHKTALDVAKVEVDR